MLSGPSLLPARPGRAVPSGLPRRTASSSTSKAPPPPVVPVIAIEQAVASTSKLSPPPSTPARSEYEASRLDWADLLAERSDVDLLNDESATWLLDRSAFTIGARTPAKALATSDHRRSLAVDPEDGVEEDLRPLAQDVVQPLRNVPAEIEDVRLETEALADSHPLSSSPPRRRSATPAEQQSAHPKTQSLSACGQSPSQPEPGNALVDHKQEGEERVHEAANEPMVDDPTSLSPRRPTEVDVCAQQRRSRSPVLPRRHLPSLAPLSRSSALPPDLASEPFLQAPQEILPTSSPKQSLPSIPTNTPELQLAGSDTVPIVAIEAEPGVLPTEKEHASMPAAAAPVVSPPTSADPPDEVLERIPTARARLPRASLAVTTAAAGAPALVRPAHILPADHPAHPRLPPSTTAMVSSATTSSSMKGVRGPDEEAKKKVREAKEARERSARERKEKAEKAATALREAAKREKGRAEEAATAAAAAAAVVAQKAAPARKELVKAVAPPPSRPTSNTGPTAGRKSTDTDPEAAPVGPAALTTAAAPAPSSLSNRSTRAEAEAEDHLAKSAPPMPPPIVIIETEGNSHDEISRQLDPNVTLPDMGAPLDFGPGTSASVNGASAPAARVTSTPAHHRKRKGSHHDSQVGGLQQGGLPNRDQKRPRRISDLEPQQPTPPLADLAASSQKAGDNVHKAEGGVATSLLTASVPAAPVTASATEPSAAVPTKRRRPSRAGQLVHSTASLHDVPLAPIDNSRTNGASDGGPGPGRSRLVRVTLVAPAPLPRSALDNDTTSLKSLPSIPSGPPRRSSSSPAACEDSQPLPVQSAGEASQPQQAAEARPKVRIRRASRVASTGDTLRHPGLGTNRTHPEPAPAVSAGKRPIASRPVDTSSAPISSPPSAVHFPPRPRLKPAEIIGGITLPATFSFAEPNEESEAERQRRLLEKERREKAAELVFAEKKRLRESASAWAIRPDETAKRPRLSELSETAPAVETTSKSGAVEVNHRPIDSAVSAPRLHRPPRRSIAHPPQQQQSIIIDKEAATEPDDAQPEPPLALTKEALERNARKAGPRPDLQRRVSRFLEEISEAEEPLEDSALLSRDDEAQVAEAADAAAARVDHAPVASASEPVVNVPEATQAGMPAAFSSAAPASEQQPRAAANATATTLPAAKAPQPKLVGKVTNLSTLVRRARTDDDTDSSGAKKPRREPATATASVVPTKPTPATTTTTAAARPRGQENGAAQYSVAAELEKQLQARLEWSERQKRREEEAKRFRQRQRDEEAAREREKLAQLRSALNQARRKPAAQGPAGPRKVGRT